MPAIVRVVDLVKTYPFGGGPVHALRGVSLEIEDGDFVALTGPSGSGKSTLLNLLGCLDRPTGGRYFLGGEDVSAMDEDGRSDVRGRYIGFVFQAYNLLPQYSVVENIAVPLLYQGGRGDDDTRARCVALAELVGLGGRLHHRPRQLSGGQQQRVAIARALVNNPPVILADEPTGNLDSRTGVEIMHLLAELNRSGKTVVVVTHESEVAAWAGRVVRLRDGQVESDGRNDESPEPAPAPERASETPASGTLARRVWEERGG
jgi:putative ABC transport system ATP-binding protein